MNRQVRKYLKHDSSGRRKWKKTKMHPDTKIQNRVTTLVAWRRVLLGSGCSIAWGCSIAPIALCWVPGTRRSPLCSGQGITVLFQEGPPWWWPYMWPQSFGREAPARAFMTLRAFAVHSTQSWAWGSEVKWVFSVTPRILGVLFSGGLDSPPPILLTLAVPR